MTLQERDHRWRLTVRSVFLSALICLSLASLTACRRSSDASREAACEAAMQEFFWLYEKHWTTSAAAGDEGFRAVAGAKRISCPCNDETDVPFHYTGIARGKELGIVLVEKEACHRGRRSVMFSDGAVLLFSDETWTEQARTYLQKLADGARGQHIEYEWKSLILPEKRLPGCNMEDLTYETIELSSGAVLPEREEPGTQ